MCVIHEAVYAFRGRKYKCKTKGHLAITDRDLEFARWRYSRYASFINPGKVCNIHRVDSHTNEIARLRNQFNVWKCRYNPYCMNSGSIFADVSFINSDAPEEEAEIDCIGGVDVGYDYFLDDLDILNIAMFNALQGTLTNEQTMQLLSIAYRKLNELDPDIPLIPFDLVQKYFELETFWILENSLQFIIIAESPTGVTVQECEDRAIDFIKVRKKCPHLENQLLEGPNYGIGHQNNIAFVESELWKKKPIKRTNTHSPFIGLVAIAAGHTRQMHLKSGTPSLQKRLQNKLDARYRLRDSGIMILDTSLVPLFQNTGIKRKSKRSTRTERTYRINDENKVFRKKKKDALIVMYDWVTKIRLINYIMRSSHDRVRVMIAGSDVLEAIGTDRWHDLEKCCGNKLDLILQKYPHPSAWLTDDDIKNRYWADQFLRHFLENKSIPTEPLELDTTEMMAQNSKESAYMQQIRQNRRRNQLILKQLGIFKQNLIDDHRKKKSSIKKQQSKDKGENDTYKQYLPTSVRAALNQRTLQPRSAKEKLAARRTYLASLPVICVESDEESTQ